MGDMVIAVYRPKPGKEMRLKKMAQEHVPFLRSLGLATDTPNLIMEARDGSILEVFEWRSGGIEAAHTHPEIHRLWEEYAEVCEYVPLETLPETKDMFATFKPLRN